jgi:hypothetical protein
MLRVVSSRVVLLGAPFSGCACLRHAELWAHSGLELPSHEDYNFDPETRRGATGGSPPPLLASFAQLSQSTRDLASELLKSWLKRG